MRRFGMVGAALMLLAVAGCTQVQSLFDGATGKPFSDGVDSETWYHVGEVLMPVISQLFALLRMALGF